MSRFMGLRPIPTLPKCIPLDVPLGRFVVEEFGAEDGREHFERCAALPLPPCYCLGCHEASAAAQLERATAGICPPFCECSDCINDEWERWDCDTLRGWL